MSLLRSVGRTAVIAGTATSVSNRVSRRQAGRWAAQAEQAQPQQSVAGASAAPPTESPDRLAQLKQLGELKESGVLTDAEFEAEKARILGS